MQEFRPVVVCGNNAFRISMPIFRIQNLLESHLFVRSGWKLECIITVPVFNDNLLEILTVYYAAIVEISNQFSPLLPLKQNEKWC